MQKLFTSALICIMFLLGNYSLHGQYMTSVVNSAADDEHSHPWDDPDTPDNDESVDGVCEDEMHRCTFRAALEEAYNVGKAASITFSGNTVIVINEQNGPFDIPEGSRILGLNRNISIFGHGESTFLLVGVNNKTIIQGMVLNNALIGMAVGDSNHIGSSFPEAVNYVGGMFQNGIVVSGNSNTIVGNVIGLDDMDEPAHNKFGISVYGGNNTIEANVISGNGIGLSGYKVDTLFGDNYIISNKIGTNRAGTQARGNQVGLEIIGPGFFIGGSDPTDGNIISGNIEEGILLGLDADNIIIQNNHIGVDESGSIPIPNRDGITLGPGSFNSSVYQNLISKNVNNGILVSGILGDSLNSNDHVIDGNEISFNGNAGIQFSGQALNTIVGSSLDEDFEANHILYNGRAGINFEPGFAGTPSFNTIRKNFFENNTLEGISILNSQENIMPPSDLDYDELVVFGTYPIPGAVIDVYEGVRNNAGQYEGNGWLGSGVVNANGVFDIDVESCSCDTLVATATSPEGSTSEFSDGFPTTITATHEINSLNNIAVYPNPFHQSTSITFALHTSQQVSLKIFDLTGQEIETLASQKLHAGEHSFIWSPKGVIEGVYYFQLVTDEGNVKQGKLSRFD